jgi:hypothetical protein
LLGQTSTELHECKVDLGLTEVLLADLRVAITPLDGGCWPSAYHWGKSLGLIVLGLFIILGALFITAKLLTSRLETDIDPHTFESWGPGTSFLSTRSGDVHILDIGEVSGIRVKNYTLNG